MATTRPSIRAAGLDPEHLPESDPSKMNFGGASAKAWKDIWGCGQGIGPITKVQPAGEFVAQLKRGICSRRTRVGMPLTIQSHHFDQSGGQSDLKPTPCNGLPSGCLSRWRADRVNFIPVVGLLMRNNSGSSGPPVSGQCPNLVCTLIALDHYSTACSTCGRTGRTLAQVSVGRQARVVDGFVGSECSIRGIHHGRIDHPGQRDVSSARN